MKNYFLRNRRIYWFMLQQSIFLWYQINVTDTWKKDNLSSGQCSFPLSYILFKLGHIYFTESERKEHKHVKYFFTLFSPSEDTAGNHKKMNTTFTLSRSSTEVSYFTCNDFKVLAFVLGPFEYILNIVTGNIHLWYFWPV